MFNRHALWALGLCALLAGCGGGDDTAAQPIIPSEPPAQPVPFAAKGFWEGTVYAGTSSWLKTTIAVLPSGDTWGVYHYGEGTSLNVQGGFYGSLSLSGLSLEGVLHEFDYGTTATSAVQGEFSAGDDTLAFSLRSDRRVSSTRVASPQAPTTLADIAGNYKITGTSLRRLSPARDVTINSDGRFTYDDGNCEVSGALSARTDGSDQFDVTVSFAEKILYEGVCGGLEPGVPYAGQAFLQRTGSPFRLVGAALLADKSDGFYFIGERVPAQSPPQVLPPSDAPPPLVQLSR